MRKRRTGGLALSGAWFALEAQQVIALRLMRLAAGGPTAQREAHRMVAEKVDAAAVAARLSAAASARGAHDAGAGDVVRMLRRRVRANRARLLKGG